MGDLARMSKHSKNNETYRVLAVATRCTSALVRRDLHETLLVASTGSVGVARRLLHGNRGDDDRGNWTH